jgi:predicted PhzF superfamily epimerase YddE/YHI9
MKLPLYQVDAFSSSVFGGNPAAVVPLERWLDDRTMQAIAAENNLAETAFFAREAGGFRIRWFTPEIEVDLCGHATLASAHVLFTQLEADRDAVEFASKSGPLRVARDGDRLVLDFPVWTPAVCAPPPGLFEAIGAEPGETYRGGSDYLLVFGNEGEVRALAPDFAALRRVDARGVITTAPGTDVDFISRFFAPAAGVNEDPVTGSAHCALTPYWVARLRRNPLRARQISRRGGELECELAGDRVKIAGRAALYLEGTITVG